MLGTNGMEDECVTSDELKLRWNGIGLQTQYMQDWQERQ